MNAVFPATRAKREYKRGFPLPETRKVLDETIKVVSVFTRLEPSTILSRSRKAPIRDARHLLTAALRAQGLSVVQISRAIDRDHTTVLNSINVVDNFMHAELVSCMERLGMDWRGRKKKDPAVLTADQAHAIAYARAISELRNRSAFGGSHVEIRVEFESGMDRLLFSSKWSEDQQDWCWKMTRFFKSWRSGKIVSVEVREQ